MFSKHSEHMNFLKKAHGITHGFTHFIILTFCETYAASFDQDDVVANQYKNKEAIIPIFDKWHTAHTNIGAEVEVAPKKRQSVFE